MSRPRCSYERPCGQGEVGRSGSPTSTWGGWGTWPQPQTPSCRGQVLQHDKLGNLTYRWQAPKPSSFPFEGPCGSNDHSQCQAPGNEAGSNGGMLCDVECTDRCPDFLCTFPLKTTSRSWFPIERFPNNSESQGYTSQRYEWSRYCCKKVTFKWLSHPLPSLSSNAGTFFCIKVTFQWSHPMQMLQKALRRPQSLCWQWMGMRGGSFFFQDQTFSFLIFFLFRGTGSARLGWSVSCTLGKSSGSASTLTSAL